MSGQIVEIGDFRLHRAQRSYFDRSGCQHKHLTLDDQSEAVTCDDCKLQVGTYAALRMLVERWHLLQKRVDSQQRAVAEASAKTLSLRAAQKVEKAWRNRSMVPTCPHCGEAIFPEDGLGASMCNRAIAERRRASAQAAGSTQTATYTPSEP